MKLSEEQLKAVTTNDRFIFLLAGAGSGKTRVVIERIKHLLASGVNPLEILAITFTKKASEEMKQRLNNDLVLINTFHGYCYHELLKSNEKYQIIDPEILPFTKRELLEVSKFKNSSKSGKPPLIMDTYQEYLRTRKVIDFDDVLTLFLEEKRRAIFNFKYIFIDEFQDTNDLQYQILKLLINHQTNVFAVGDPDQSIYRFRGAKPSIINDFIDDYDATLLPLGNNFRSNIKIIDEANHVINKNKTRIKKQLVPNKQYVGELEIFVSNNYHDEAKFIIKKLRELLTQGYKLHEIAIMYRNHSRAIIFKKNYFDNYLVEVEPNITLLSCHEAKGLEFKVVFIIGLEDGLFPSYYDNQISEIEEERRLFFVAITRAMEKLYLFYSKNDQFGTPKKPSKFLKELNREMKQIS